MANQAILIGIAAGLFFVGLGVGYAVFSNAETQTVSMQQWQHMMQDPNQRQQMMNQMMQNPEAMNDWMNTMMGDPQTLQQMNQFMMDHPVQMQQMHQMMLEDPEHMEQMMQHMMNNQHASNQMMNTMMRNDQFMQGMMTNSQFQNNWMGPWMMNNTDWQGTMGQGMMNQGMMGHNMMNGNTMMGTSIMEDSEVIKTIDDIGAMLDNVSSEYKLGNADNALSLATMAYLEKYEYIEGKIASEDSQLMEKIELMLRRDLRHMINTDYPADDVTKHIDSIKEELAKAKALF